MQPRGRSWRTQYYRFYTETEPKSSHLSVIRNMVVHNEQLGFRPKHSISLQLVHLFERVNKNFGKKKSAAVFLDVYESMVSTS